MNRSGSRRVTRRDVLRGVGTAVTLPWLETLAAAVGNSTDGPPQRFACFYIANGVQGWDDTTQRSDGKIQFGSGLSPLELLVDDVNIIKGLQHENSVRGTHGHKGPVVLSGAKVNVSTTAVRAGTTLDQVLAQKIGNRTLQPSCVLGVEPPCPGVDSNLSSVYLNNISWSSPTRPTPRETHPALAFDSMFGAGPNRQRTKSILDAVREDARDLGRNISVADNRRLDEYLSSVRAVERRVEQLGQPQEYLTWQPSLKTPDMPRPADHIPEKLADHMRLMLDLIVLAFRMDRTRIATLMFNNERSQQNFGFLDGVNSSAYHALSHGSKEVHAKVTNFHTQLVADFLQKLKAADEGGSSILYNSQVLFLSGMHDGSHYSGRLPVMLAGHAGGKLKAGRVVSFDDQEDRRLCRLLLSISHNMGVPLSEFGDATERFEQFC